MKLSDPVPYRVAWPVYALAVAVCFLCFTAPSGCENDSYHRTTTKMGKDGSLESTETRINHDSLNGKTAMDLAKGAVDTLADPNSALSHFLAWILGSVGGGLGIAGTAAMFIKRMLDKTWDEAHAVGKAAASAAPAPVVIHNYPAPPAAAA